MNVKLKVYLQQWRYWPQLFTVAFLLLIYGSYKYFAYYDTRSDDAYVAAHVVDVTPIISGLVTQIYVQDNQKVKAGDKLFEIDPRPLADALQVQKSRWQLAQQGYAVEGSTVDMAKDQLAQSRQLKALYLDHQKRYKTLVGKGGMPEIKLIDIEEKLHAQDAVVAASEKALKIASLRYDRSHMEETHAQMLLALYDYDHTTLRASADGYVTNFNVRVGQYVHKGVALFALVETKHWWVVTRYRETAIRLIKPGDAALIKLDMYPGVVFHGHVNSVSWGINRVEAGSVAPSALTYSKETEYWVKIAQRFPVRIDFDTVDDEYPLRIGASANTHTFPQEKSPTHE